MGHKGTDTSCMARIGTLGFIVLHRSSQDFTLYCTLRSKAREKARPRPPTAKPSCSSKSAFADALHQVWPCLGVLSRVMRTASLQSIHDRLQTLSISLGSYSCDMLWMAPGSDGFRPQPRMLQAAHPALRPLFPELVLARKVRRPGEFEELQTSGVLALAETSDCIHHRLVECATQAVQQYSVIQKKLLWKLRLCQTCA